MRSVPLIGACLLFGLIASLPLAAQTSSRPHLDLVRGLRKENLPDLAMEYLKQVKASTSDPETLKVLDLEFARTRLDLAANELDEGKRNVLVALAKKELEVFLKSSPDHPLAPQANVELARLLSVQGKSMIRKARRFTEKEQFEAELKKAQPVLLDAAKKYEATALKLEEQVKQYENAKSAAEIRLKNEVNDTRLKALLDQAITQFSLGDTYVGDELKDIAARGKSYEAAKKLFQKIMFEDEKQPICWVARAWFGYTEIKAGDPMAGEKELSELIGKKSNPAAAAGIRVARYFNILYSFENSNKDPLATNLKLEKDTSEWLRDYPTQKESAEGLGCRYYLALAKRILAIPGIERDKKDNKITGIKVDAKARFEEAARLLKDLGDDDNEYAEKANRTRATILVTLADADGGGEDPPAEKLPNFERAFLMAQVQTARFTQFKLGKKVGEKDKEEIVLPTPEEIKKEELRRYINAMSYLERALKVVNKTKDTPREVFSAQLFLVGCYYQLKLYPQAAILAEHLARENPKMPKAATAGVVAMQTYNLSQIELKKLREEFVNPKEDPKNPEMKPLDDAAIKKLEADFDKRVEADNNRLLKAAAYLMTQWPTDSAADEARHLVGFYALRDKKYEEAWRILSEISTAYGAVQTARLQLASAMFTIVIPSSESDPAKFKQMVEDKVRQHKAQWDKTLSLLESVPVPDASARAFDTIPYMDSRALLARLYQLVDDMSKVQQIGESMLKTLPQYTSIPSNEKSNVKLNFKHTAENLILTAIRAKAAVAFKAGDHAEVAKLLDPRIAEIEKAFQGKEEDTVMFSRLRQMQKSVVMLALQSAAQSSKIERASALLNVLKNSGGSVDEQMAMLGSLVTSVRAQIEELDADQQATADKAKDAKTPPAEKTGLLEEATRKAEESTRLKKGFKDLLQTVSGEGDKLPMKMKLFLANGMSNIKAFPEAAKILEEINAMKSPPKPADLAADANDEAQAKYKKEFEDFDNFKKYQRQAEIFLARNYRDAKDYPKALVAYTKMIGNVNSKVPIPKDPKDKGWAFSSLTIRKEKANLLEEIALTTPLTAPDRVAKWGAAVQEWVTLSKTFSPQLVAIKVPLPPEEAARSMFKRFFNGKRAPSDVIQDGFLLEWTFLLVYAEQAYKAEREKDTKDTTDTAAKRSLYFEFYYEQKRCSVMAFETLGLAAVGNDQAKLDEKFVDFAKAFQLLQSKSANPDLPQSIKDEISKLMEKVPRLKKASKALPPLMPPAK